MILRFLQPNDSKALRPVIFPKIFKIFKKGGYQ